MQLPANLLEQVLLSVTEFYIHLSVWGKETARAEALKQLQAHLGENRLKVKLSDVNPIVQVQIHVHILSMLNT